MTHGAAWKRPELAKPFLEERRRWLEELGFAYVTVFSKYPELALFGGVREAG